MFAYFAKNAKLTEGSGVRNEFNLELKNNLRTGEYF